MNPQLLASLENSIAYVDRLLSLLELEKASIRRCIGGPVLAEYLLATDKAVELINLMRNELVVLQAKQAIGL